MERHYLFISIVWKERNQLEIVKTNKTWFTTIIARSPSIAHRYCDNFFLKPTQFLEKSWLHRVWLNRPWFVNFHDWTLCYPEPLHDKQKMKENTNQYLYLWNLNHFEVYLTFNMLMFIIYRQNLRCLGFTDHIIFNLALTDIHLSFQSCCSD